MVGSTGHWRNAVHPGRGVAILATMESSTGSRGGLLRLAIGIGLIAAIFAFLGYSLASNWNELRSEDFDIQPVLVVVSAVPLIAAILLQSLIWRRLVDCIHGGETPLSGQLSKVFLYSWVGRYVPGKVAYVAGRFFLGRSIGFTVPVLVSAMAYELALLLVAGSAFATLTVLPSVAVESETIWPYLALPAIALAGLSALHPRVLRWAAQIGSRIAGREGGDFQWLLSLRAIVGFGLGFFVVFCLNGAAFYLLIVSVTSLSPGYLPLAAGAFALGSVFGLLSIVTPAGIGVREGILVTVLHVAMPLEVAIVVSLVARIWTTVVDLLVVGGVLAYDYVSGERMLQAALRGDVVVAEEG
jgi:hypothetical protein